MADAYTRIADAIVPSVYAQYSFEEHVQSLEIYQAGILFSDPSIASKLSLGGRSVDMPGVARKISWHLRATSFGTRYLPLQTRLTTAGLTKPGKAAAPRPYFIRSQTVSISHSTSEPVSPENTNSKPAVRCNVILVGRDRLEQRASAI